ncbi:MAG: hypothetical protein ACHQPI_01595 [Thermoanaerobaculia bacterium]
MATSRFSATALLGVALFVSACSTHHPIKRDFPNFRSFAADFDRTFSAVTEAAAEFTLPITSISRDSGLVTVQWIAMPKEWLDCYAQPPSPGTSHAAYLINILVRRESATRTKVTVNSFMTRTDMPVSLSECYSTGSFEDHFFSTIEKKLK